MEKQASKSYLFDNLRVILITFVVLGNLVAPMLAGKMQVVYIYINIFHMPLLVFCSGYSAEFNPQKIVKNLIYPYMLFQTLYLVFDKILLKKEGIPLQIFSPYWLMWYVFALAVWTMALPIIEVIVSNKIRMIITMGIALLLGLIAGFTEIFGGFSEVMKVFYYLPFFIFGYWIKKFVGIEKFHEILSKWYVKHFSFLITAVIMWFLYMFYGRFNFKWLFGSYSYIAGEYSYRIRLFCYAAAVIISIFVITVTPRKKLFFSKFGERTLQVYLLHGFIISVLSKYGIIYNTISRGYQRIIIVTILAALLVLGLSSNPVQKISSPLMSFPFKFNDIDFKKFKRKKKAKKA